MRRFDWVVARARRHRGVSTGRNGTVADGGGATGHARTRGRARSNEHDASDPKVAAPSSIVHRSGAGVHDRGGGATATSGFHFRKRGRGEKGWGGSHAHP